MKLNTSKLAARVERARSVTSQKVRYRLGKGGLRPLLTTPAPESECDCSGFAAWVLGISRYQEDKKKPWSKAIPWIETTAIVADATGPQLLFKKVILPRPGCLVVYGDNGRKQGHVGVISRFVSSWDFDVIDCNASLARKIGGKAIGEGSRHAFLGNPRAIFVALNEDFL